MGTVLVVDDSASERELLGRLVRASGHQPEFAVDGKEALAKARALKPRLILLDVVMPTLDGFSACRQLKRDPATASIPVVLITLKGSETDLFWGRKQGADDHIVKPFSADLVKAAIARFAGGGA